VKDSPNLEEGRPSDSDDIGGSGIDAECNDYRSESEESRIKDPHFFRGFLAVMHKCLGIGTPSPPCPSKFSG
jgi:hypothetical protein